MTDPAEHDNQTHPPASPPNAPTGQPYGGYGPVNYGPVNRSGPPAPKPGVIPLRPLGVGEILDGAISYIRANPKVTLGLSAVVVTITQLIQVPLTYTYVKNMSAISANPSAVTSFDQLARSMSGGLTTAALGGFLSSIAITLLTGLLIVVLARAVMGQQPTLAEAWAAVKGQLVGLLGLTLLTSVILVAVFALGFAPLLIALATGAPTSITLLLGLLILVALVAMVFLWVSLSMVTPAYVLEDIPMRAAFVRSFRLVRPAWWRIFGILMLGFLISAVIGGILAVPFGLVATAVDGGFVPAAAAALPLTPPALVISGIGAIVGQTITAPFSAGITGLLYFDQRMRREALDLQLAAAAGAGPNPSGAAPGQVW